MELQILHGNPMRRKKRKKSRKKSSKTIAKKKKNRKTYKVGKKSKKGSVMAKKKRKVVRRRPLKKKRNPSIYIAKKRGKPARKSDVFLTKKEAKKLRGKILGIESKLKKAVKKDPGRLRGETIMAIEAYNKNQPKVALAKKLLKKKEDADAFKKAVEAEGYKVTTKTLGGSMAKRKKKKSSKKKSSKKKKVTKRKAKISHKRKTHKKKAHKRKSSYKKRSHKRRGKKRSKASKVVARLRAGKRRTSAKIAGPGLKKGKSISKELKRKRRRYKVMVKRTNPLFGASRAVNKLDKQFETATGHDLKEAGLLFGAGASLPVIEALLSKIPGMSQLKEAVGKFGPEASAMSSSVATIVGLGALHYAMEKVPALSKAKAAEPVVRALIAASVVKAGSALSGTVAKVTGLAGVLYTPDTIQGINFTPEMRGYSPQLGIYPQMNGINFTPEMGHTAPQLGVTPQMGADADFGRMGAGFDVADYGGGDGYTESHKYSPANFGGDEEPVLDQSGGVV